MSEIDRPSETRLSMRAELQGSMRNVAQEAEGIARAAIKIANMIEETATKGGTVQIQPQVVYLTGAMARMMKDLGVVEHLQKHGAAIRSRALIRKV